MAVLQQRRDSQSQKGLADEGTQSGTDAPKFRMCAMLISAGHRWLIERGERARQPRPPRAIGYMVPQD